MPSADSMSSALAAVGRIMLFMLVYHYPTLSGRNLLFRNGLIDTDSIARAIGRHSIARTVLFLNGRRALVTTVGSTPNLPGRVH